MKEENLKWLAIEVGIVLIAGIALLARMAVAVNFNITSDGYCLSLFAFGLGMLVRDVVRMRG